MSQWWHFKPSRPRKAKGGIKARTLGSSWWSKRWLEVLDSFGWTNRMARGRSYARRGQVLDFDLSQGQVTAKVQGSQARPYAIVIRLKVLNDGAWRKVLAAMASRAAFAAKLLAGTLPDETEDVFRAADVPLFPASERDFDVDCSCPDAAELCKHIAAVHYVLAERFDRDPFMLFELRGRPKKEVLAAIASSSPGSAAEAVEPLNAARFWDAGPGLSTVTARPVAPDVALSVMKRLGEPGLLKGERWKRLSELYRNASAKALELGKG